VGVVVRSKGTGGSVQRFEAWSFLPLEFVDGRTGQNYLGFLRFMNRYIVDPYREASFVLIRERGKNRKAGALLMKKEISVAVFLNYCAICIPITCEAGGLVGLVRARQIERPWIPFLITILTKPNASSERPIPSVKSVKDVLYGFGSRGESPAYQKLIQQVSRATLALS